MQRAWYGSRAVSVQKDQRKSSRQCTECSAVLYQAASLDLRASLVLSLVIRAKAGCVSRSPALVGAGKLLWSRWWFGAPSPLAASHDHFAKASRGTIPYSASGSGGGLGDICGFVSRSRRLHRSASCRCLFLALISTTFGFAIEEFFFVHLGENRIIQCRTLQILDSTLLNHKHSHFPGCSLFGLTSRVRLSHCTSRCSSAEIAISEHSLSVKYKDLTLAKTRRVQVKLIVVMYHSRQRIAMSSLLQASFASSSLRCSFPILLINALLSITATGFPAILGYGGCGVYGRSPPRRC